MDCPECSGEMVYQELVDGAYVYPVKGGIIQWEDGELDGECHGHSIRCRACGHELPVEEFHEILNRSLN